MTLVADPAAPAASERSPRRPLRVHVAALAVVLLALVPVIGTHASLSADEGAAIVQAKSLSRGEGWIVAHPAPQVDPTGIDYPFENADHGARGVAPYAKHPLYPVLLASAGRLGGVTGMILLSLAGTLVAASLSALMARRLDPALAVPTLWVVGLGSPLLFDGFLAMGHAVGAALAVGAVLLAWRAVERRSVAATAALAPTVAAGVLLRTEFVFLALALAAAVGIVGLLGRRVVFPALVAGTAVAAGAAARLGEHAWVARILGPAVAAPGGPAALPSGGLAGRVHGFVITWLTPGYGATGSNQRALLAALAGVGLAALVVRYRPSEARVVVALSVTAAVAALLALAIQPDNVVPGLLVAFPLLAAGLLSLRPTHVASSAARLAAATSGLFALAVIATQYQRGGSGEWGGRYFALAVPVVAPIALLALRDAGRRLPLPARRVVAGSLIAVTIALSLMAVTSLRVAHGRNAAMNAAVAAAVAGAPAGDGGLPVVVAADGAIARHGWPTFDRARWLLGNPDAGDLAARLRAAGIPRFVLVTRDPAAPGPGLTTVSRRDGGGNGRYWHVLVVDSQ